MKLRLLLFILMIIGGKLFGSCGSENCPLYHFHYNREGGLHLRLSGEYINQDQIFVGTSKSFVGAIPEDHDEVSTINFITMIQLQYGISDRLDFGFIFPYVHREHNHIHHENGTNVPESWNFSGPGDIVLTGNYSIILPEMNKEVYLGVSAGIKLPTGITDEVNSEGELAEVTLQPGTGSVDALLGLNFRYPLFTYETTKQNQFSTIPLIIGLSYKIPGKGTDDYRFGRALLATLGTDYQFSDKVSFTLQFNLKNQEYDDTGSTGEPGENTGGTKVFVSPGLNLNLTDYLSLFGIIQLPVYQNVHGIQQTSRFNTQLGLSANTSLL